MEELIRKLKFKGGGVVINAPGDLEKQFAAYGFNTSFDKQVKSRNTLIFINNGSEWIEFLRSQLKNIEPDSVLWFAYPKGTSGIKTDINRDILRVSAAEFGITTVAAVSINDIWSGLRFRPTDKVGR